MLLRIMIIRNEQIPESKNLLFLIIHIMQKSSIIFITFNYIIV